MGAKKSRKTAVCGLFSSTIKILNIEGNMAFTKQTTRYGPCIDVGYTYAGVYGAKGETRNKKVKPTPEQIKKQNQRNRERYVKQILYLNFKEGDSWACLKYKKGYRPPPEVVLQDFKKFWERLRYRYKKRGQPLKMVVRLEIGKFGGAHIHIVVNEIGDTGKLIAESWKKTENNSGVNLQFLQDNYEDLAAYIVKEPKGQAMEQISMFPEEMQKQFIKYTCSRNLVHPQTEKKQYSHWTMAKILRDGPTPTPGYYIEKATLRVGINPFTGYSYMHYTERKLEKERGDPPWK